MSAKGRPQRQAGRPPAPSVAVPALCPMCGREVPVLEALVYHGIVYHPRCVFPGGELDRDR